MEAFNSVLQPNRQDTRQFWGVIFGSFFTLLGVHLTNRAADTRSNREREMAFP